jgi:glycosyltransferase involved in cell wall biosynthesis
VKKISIITINFNNKVGLQKTIESVISQKEFLFEYLVIDGGSSDGSVEIIQQYKERITYWVSEKDNGIYDAMNKGIKNANGEYLLFLNSGDFLCHANVLEEAVSFGFDKEIIYGDMKIDWGNNITNGFMPESINTLHMIKDTLWHPVAFIDRSLFNKFGDYDLSYSMVADYDFFFKVLIKHQCTRKHIPLFVTEYNTQGLSSDPTKKHIETKEREQVMQSYLDAEELKQLKMQIRDEKGFWNVILNFIKLKFS